MVKQDGSIRICGDYKVTVNQAAKRDMYPLPQVDDLLASLAGGKSFTSRVPASTIGPESTGLIIPASSRHSISWFTFSRKDYGTGLGLQNRG